jgi:hypothetical protein
MTPASSSFASHQHRLHVLVLTLCALTTIPRTAYAQSATQTGAQASSADVTRGRCPAARKVTAPSDEQRRSARTLVSRAQQAVIVDDHTSARDLYERAVVLDPTDATTAYALARTYESLRDPRAVNEYCRFLALAPNAPEAADVRQRLTSLTFANRTAGSGGIIPRRLPSPGGAMARGIFFPGAGQYYSRRPFAGFLVTAASVGAIVYGMQSKSEQGSVTREALDPFGNPYTYRENVVTTSRPNMSTGIAAAAGISVIAAIEAAVHAGRQRRALAHYAPNAPIAPTVTMLSPNEYGSAVGVGVRIALR